MEIWNPRTREVQLLWDEIPPEVGIETYGLHLAKSISVNDGSELFVYGGGFNLGSSNEIWKYTVKNNTWKK